MHSPTMQGECSKWDRRLFYINIYVAVFKYETFCHMILCREKNKDS